MRIRRKLVLFVAGLAAVAPALAASNPATAAAAGNVSLVLYRTTAAPTGYLATFDKTYYDGLGPANFSSNWTNIAVSRDSILFYDAASGVGVTGTFKDGAFTQLHTYGFSTGWDSVTASCDSVVFYNVGTQISVSGTLVGGAFAQKQTRHWNNKQFVAASCDTLMLYLANGTALTTKFAHGIIAPGGTTYHLGAISAAIAASADTALLYKPSTGATISGTLTGGHWKRIATTPPKAALVGADVVAATTNSALLYNSATGSAVRARLSGGKFAVAGTTAGFSTDWSIIVGGK